MRSFAYDVLYRTRSHPLFFMLCLLFFVCALSFGSIFSMQGEIADVRGLLPFLGAPTIQETGMGLIFLLALLFAVRDIVLISLPALHGALFPIGLLPFAFRGLSMGLTLGYIMRESFFAGLFQGALCVLIPQAFFILAMYPLALSVCEMPLKNGKAVTNSFAGLVCFTLVCGVISSAYEMLVSLVIFVG